MVPKNHSTRQDKSLKGTIPINWWASWQDNLRLDHIDSLLITVRVCTTDSIHKVCFDAKQAAARSTSRNYSRRAYCPCEVRVRRRCGNKIWQNLSTKHLSTGRLAGSRQERTWLNLYLECQQLNYYTAQRECVCVCVCVWVCGPAQ